MHRRTVSAVGHVVDRLGLLALLALLVPLAFSFGVVHVFFLDGSLHHASVHRVTLPGIELAVVPLSALIAARWRPGANRLRSMRESVIGPYLALLLAATLVGLIACLEWSWRTPSSTIRPDDIGLLR